MSASKEKLMILGAGKFQIPIIRLAQEMGFYTIVVSVSGKYPGFLVADRSYMVDVRERNAILEIARREQICGIVTDQTDIPVPTVAYVAEKLGLPGIGYECALRITDKVRCRLHCQQMQFPIPAFFVASSLEKAVQGVKNMNFPLVVKPSDSQGGRGVFKLHHPDELGKTFKNAILYSAAKSVILEECFEGKELMVVSIMDDFKYRNLMVGELKHFDLPKRFIWRQSMYPDQLRSDLSQRVVDLDRRIYESFGLSFGILFSQYKVNKNTGDVCLMETAVRGPASLQSSHVVPLVCGIDILPLFIELASGRRKIMGIEKKQTKNLFAGSLYFYLPQGVIHRINGMEEIQSLPGVHGHALHNLDIGVKVEKMTNATHRQGPIVISGKDPRAFEEKIQRIQETLKIEVETDNGIGSPIWR